ncbi:MAG: hypothetical protein JXB85_06495 [Anaerolineales bacterium]|nr:hypothetical protein [Anaerolineales bacterium]
MSASQTPYFIWDYDLTDADLRAILRGDDEEQKAWLVARLLEAARYEDIWQYITLAELRGIFPKLQLKPRVRSAWEFALSVWAADQPAEPAHEH